MNMPNKLTLLRVALIPFFIFFLLQPSVFSQVIAFLIFVIASITDFADGYIARKYNLITNFGKFVDPLADKLLVLSALILFISLGKMSAVAVFIIVARELMVTGLRTVALEKGRVLAASWTGKVKTCVQLAGVILMLATGILNACGIASYTGMIDTFVGWSMAAVTFYSGFDYLRKNSDVIFEKTQRDTH